MVFSSSVFLYAFLPIFLAVYYLSPRGLRSFSIALGSYLFYGWWRPDFVLLMLISTVIDFSCGRAIRRCQESGLSGKRYVTLSCCANLGLLAYFKYANFGVDTLNTILQSMGSEPVSWTRVVLPIGISFYTFQTMSYTIDVYRKHAPPVERFRDFMCYVALFPQLIAGPIVRYQSIAEQLRHRTHTFGKFFQGVLFFQSGFAKKILLADMLAPVAEQAFGGAVPGMAGSWLGILAFTFQVYFDFSGYSDMAMGLGLMLGFRLPINFNKPYRAVDITDFWRRWHISLSTWLRDYLYRPLGGNRKGTGRTYFNLFLTMTLGGLWHGAEWTLVVWGMYNGAWLILERLCGKRSLYAWAPRPVQIAITFAGFMLGLAIFRCTDIPHALEYTGSMLGLQAGAVSSQSLRPIQLLAFAVGAVIIWGLPTSQRLVHLARPLYTCSMQPVFILAVLHLHYSSHVPFLYYQF